MQKRIAWYGHTTEAFKALKRAAKRKQAGVVAVGAKDGPPTGVSALVVDAAQASKALGAALALGAWNESVLELLAHAIDCREGFLPGSSLRVVEHAARFATALGLSPEEQLTLERGALLRDLGKIRIPNDVLLKPGVLTYDEWKLLQDHPILGAEIAVESGGLSDIAAIVRSHHERFDGEGYPDGLEGEAIPYLARIVKVIDVYCAMTSPRLYRKSHSTHREAVSHLRKERGKHFDPKLIEVFVQADIGKPNAASRS